MNSEELAKMLSGYYKATEFKDRFIAECRKNIPSEFTALYNLDKDNLDLIWESFDIAWQDGYDTMGEECE